MSYAAYTRRGVSQVNEQHKSTTFDAAEFRSDGDAAQDWLGRITAGQGMSDWLDSFEFEPEFEDELQYLDYLVGIRKSPAPTKGPPGHPYGAGGGLDAATEQWQRNQSQAYFRILDWIRGRKFDVVDGDPVKVDVPLFVLSAPDVEGCEVTYSVEDLEQGKAELSLTFFGNGIVADAIVECKATSTFSAAEGEVREVFLPLWIRPRRVVVRNTDGAVVGTGHFAQPFKGKEVVRPGTRVLPNSPYSADASGESELYPLRNDSVGAKATYQAVYTAGASFGVSLGFKAFDNDNTAKLGLRVQRSITLESVLRGGHDYRMSRTAEIPGIVWEVVSG
jgi:hypothetical protein